MVILNSTEDIKDFAKAMRSPSGVPRRDAYLFTWGAGYIVLALYWFAYGGYRGLSFMLVGLISFLASMLRSQYWKAISFALLAGAAVLHAFNFIWAFPFSELSMPRQMLVLWVIVALSHVIVAGWPAHCHEHHPHITMEGNHDKEL